MYDENRGNNIPIHSCTLLTGHGSDFPASGHVTGSATIRVYDSQLLMDSEEWANYSSLYSWASYLTSDPNVSQVYGAISMASDLRARALANLAILDEVVFQYDKTNPQLQQSLGANDSWRLVGILKATLVNRFERLYEDTDHDGFEINGYEFKTIRSPLLVSPVQEFELEQFGTPLNLRGGF